MRSLCRLTSILSHSPVLTGEETDRLADATVNNTAIAITHRVNPTDNTHFFFASHADTTSMSNDTFQFTLTTPDGAYTVPQQSGTALRLNGRDSKILLADYNFGAQHLVYSTSELLTQTTIDGRTGDKGVYSVWLNGAFLGSYSNGSHTISVPPGSLTANTPAEVSVLIGNMGHDEDFVSSDSQKSPRGLTWASLQGSTATLNWKIQGAKGGENTSDPARGQFNTGGLFGERNGWYLPGYNTTTWNAVTLPDRWSASNIPAGVGWYRTSFNLNLPAKMDVPLGLQIADTTASHYQALIYVNGWLVGRYWNTVGPQSTFSLPAGVLNTQGHNDVAIAVWGLDAQGGGLGQVSLTPYGSYAQ